MRQNNEENKEINVSDAFKETVHFDHIKLSKEQIELYKTLKNHYFSFYEYEDVMLNLNEAYLNFLEDDIAADDELRQKSMFIWRVVNGILQCVFKEEHPEASKSTTIIVPSL